MCSCKGRTRTCDPLGMNQASYQLLHLAAANIISFFQKASISKKKYSCTNQFSILPLPSMMNKHNCQYCGGKTAQTESHGHKYPSSSIVEGKVPIFHIIMDNNVYGMTKVQSRRADMAEEYAVVIDTDASAGIIIYGRYNGEWIPNPYSTRWLVRALLENLALQPNDVRFLGK
jgi:hypothetical protein